MRISSLRIRNLAFAVAALGMLGCGGGGDSTTPTDNNPGGNGGGPVGSITIGNNFFQSAHNGTKPAVDTVPANTAVTWTWTSTGSISHSVRSEGTPSFTSSDIKTGNGSTYSVTFATPGTYQYDCAVHGSAMTGRIVVQ